MKYFFFNMTSFLAAAVFLFNLTWGCNYERTSFEKQINLLVLDMDSTALLAELHLSAQDMTRSYQTLHQSKFKYFEKQALEDTMRQTVSDFLKSKHFPAGGRIRGRILANGFLLRFGTSGVYMPWLGESNIDGGLHGLEQPFTLAHEFAHGYGWTDEGSCNFIAYLACMQSSNPLVRYSACLDYYRYVASNYRYNHQKEYELFRISLPQGVQDDLNAINSAIKKYPNWVSFTEVYGYYLRSQGIKEGMKSYSKVVRLVYSSRQK